MAIADTAKSLFLKKVSETEFDLSGGDLSSLEIRPASDEKFYFFYDMKAGRLVKSFVLRSGPKVDVMCDVFLIKKDNAFTPRLNFWKKDKGKGWADTLTDVELVA